MRRTTLISSFALGLFCTAALGQMHTNPVSLKTSTPKIAATFFSLDTIEYEEQNNKTDIEVERKVLGLELATDTKNNFGLVGQLTFAPDVKYPNGGDGTGYSIAGGVRGKFDTTKDGTIFLAGFFSYLKDDIDYQTLVGKLDVDVTVTELTLQAAYATAISPKVSLYGAVDVIPMVDGELKSTPGGKVDIERDDLVRLRIGTNIFSSGYIFRPEFAFIGGQSITLAVAKAI